MRCRRCGRKVGGMIKIRVETIERVSSINPPSGEEKKMWENRNVEENVYCKRCLGVK